MDKLKTKKSYIDAFSWIKLTEKEHKRCALAAAQWNSHQQKFSEETESLAEYSASMYAKTPEEKAYYLDYYRNYYRNGGTSENAAPKPSSESAVIVNGIEYKRYRKS